MIALLKCWKNKPTYLASFARGQFHQHFTGSFIVRKCFFESFLYLQFMFVTFWWKEISKKAARKMMVKWTTALIFWALERMTFYRRLKRLLDSTWLDIKTIPRNYCLKFAEISLYSLRFISSRFFALDNKLNRLTVLWYRREEHSLFFN